MFHGVLNTGRCPYRAHFTDGRTKAEQIKKEGEKKGTGEGTKRERTEEAGTEKRQKLPSQGQRGKNKQSSPTPTWPKETWETTEHGSRTTPRAPGGEHFQNFKD